MKITPEEYILLCEKYVSGLCTPEEERLLREYQDIFEPSEQLWNDAVMGDKEGVKTKIRAGLENAISEAPRTVLHRRWINGIAAAAVFIVISGVYFHFHAAKNSNPAGTSRFKNDIAAGGNKAILTLDNGSSIVLDDAGSGVLAREGNTEVKKGAGRLIYSAAGGAASIKYNTVSTPAGGQYQIVLPDKSRVWLNAGSSIRFPTIFTGKERQVELTGEAYFEISKNAAMPFKVSVNSLQVKVLGTHFNIMAYGNEDKTSTTLLEGSVEISKGKDQKQLKPGQQASVVNGKDNISVEEVDAEQFIAWKNGYFVFNNENIESIMRQIARWYNVEVKYQGNLENRDFVGRVSRNENVSQVLKMLELTGVIHFEIEGRRITVMP